MTTYDLPEAKNLTILDVLAWLEDIASADDKAMIAAALDIDFEAKQPAVPEMNGLLGVKVGDRVKFNGNVRPQYLVGAPGVVTAIKRGEVVVDLDKGYGHTKYSGGRNAGARYWYGIRAGANQLDPA